MNPCPINAVASGWPRSAPPGAHTTRQPTRRTTQHPTRQPTNPPTMSAPAPIANPFLASSLDLARLRAVVDEHFPEYWGAVEACCATAATLTLKDNANPTALILTGPSGCGKTTVAESFGNYADRCYRSDKFTPAAFVSHTANKSKAELAQMDLLPKIKHKVLVSSELAPIFRGKHEELVDRFSIITRVMDGQGYTSDTGMHGRRGYIGDYLFSWIGCTTPFPLAAWQIMAQLGSRLYFYALDGGASTTENDLLGMDDGASYQAKVTAYEGALVGIAGPTRGPSAAGSPAWPA